MKNVIKHNLFTVIVFKFDRGDAPENSFTDVNLRFTCSSYVWGAVCNLSCIVNFELEGSSTVTCEANKTNNPPTTLWRHDSTMDPSCKGMASFCLFELSLKVMSIVKLSDNNFESNTRNISST